MRFKISIILLTVSCILLCALVYGQDITRLLQKADQLEKTLQEGEALKVYQQVLKVQPANPKALCRASELCSRIGFRQEKESARMDFYRAAKKYAELALSQNGKNSDAHLVMAMAVGRMAMVASGKDRFAAAKDIKTYAENAIFYDKNSYKAYHILGKWHYEIVSLNSIQRGAMKLLFGELPKASLAESIQYFEQARKIHPGFILNYLELARAYEKNNQRKQAREALTAMLPLPNLTIEDSASKKEAEMLLKKWR